MWVVPTANAAVASDVSKLSIFVGIDGFGDGSHHVVQVGSTNLCMNIPMPVDLAWAWVEWIPGKPQPIEDFSVLPGDVLAASVTAESPTSVMWMIWCNRTNQFKSGTISPPSGVFGGVTAEWIVERPAPDGGGYHPLPNFGQVSFILSGADYAASIGSPALGEVNAIDGNLVNMRDIRTKATLATTSIQGQAVVVTYDRSS
jgi:hypothetical protein